MNRDLYNSLADLLSYPGEQTGAALDCAQSAIGNRQSTIAPELAAFAEAFPALSLHDQQELYIRTFDLNPVCSLEMGWHLFGENYDRGLLLVKMRQQLRAHGLAESTELPDHLTHALRLLPCMEPDSASYFAEAVVLAALEKMLPAFKDKNNPYEHVLEAARLAIRADFPEITFVAPPRVALPVLA